jgi:hypothetical protein
MDVTITTDLGASVGSMWQVTQFVIADDVGVKG